MNNLQAVFLTVLLAAASSSRAEEMLLRGATVHTVSGETLVAGDVHVRDGQILEVGTDLLVSVECEVITLDGHHLYPGLIAATTSLGLSEINAVRATRDTTEVGAFTPDVESWIALNPDSELLHVARANGITHFMTQPMGGVVSGQSAVMSMEGWTTEEMTLLAPAALHVSWPSMQLLLEPPKNPAAKKDWKSPADQVQQQQKKIEELRGFVREAMAYHQALEIATASDRPVSRVPAWDAMAPFVNGERPLFVNANAISQIRAACSWQEALRDSDAQVRLVITGGRDAWKVAPMLAELKIPVIYHHTFSLPTRDHDSYDVQFAAPGILEKAGVTFALCEAPGSWTATTARNLPYQAAHCVPYGLSSGAAVRSITLGAAEILGVDGRIGSIEAGKEATMIAVNGDILDIRSQVKKMWILGVEIELSSRHTRLNERYRSRPGPAKKGSGR